MDGSDGTISEIIGEIEKTLLIFFNYLIPITWAWTTSHIFDLIKEQKISKFRARNYSVTIFPIYYFRYVQHFRVTDYFFMNGWYPMVPTRIPLPKVDFDVF